MRAHRRAPKPRLTMGQKSYKAICLIDGTDGNVAAPSPKPPSTTPFRPSPLSRPTAAARRRVEKLFFPFFQVFYPHDFIAGHEQIIKTTPRPATWA